MTVVYRPAHSGKEPARGASIRKRRDPERNDRSAESEAPPKTADLQGRRHNQIIERELRGMLRCQFS